MAFVLVPLLGFTTLGYSLYSYYYTDENKTDVKHPVKVDNDVINDIKKIKIEGKNITGIQTKNKDIDLMTELKSELKRRRIYIE